MRRLSAGEALLRTSPRTLKCALQICNPAAGFRLPDLALAFRSIRRTLAGTSSSMASENNELEALLPASGCTVELPVLVHPFETIANFFGECIAGIAVHGKTAALLRAVFSKRADNDSPARLHAGSKCMTAGLTTGAIPAQWLPARQSRRRRPAYAAREFRVRKRGHARRGPRNTPWLPPR